MDETTTDADLQETQAQDAQPVEQPAEAVTTADSEPQQPEQEDASEPAQADTSDDDLSDWASKKGIDLSTPEGQAKALKSWREAEKAMHHKSQEASQLKKSLVDQPVTVDSDNPLVQSLAEEVVTMKRQAMIDSFTSKVNMTSDQEAEFAKYIIDTNKADLINGGYLTLEEAYKLSGVGSVDPSTYKSQGKQEALQTLANKQTATAVKGSASSNSLPAGVTKANVDQWWDSLGTAGRQDPANRAQLDRILAS